MALLSEKFPHVAKPLTKTRMVTDSAFKKPIHDFDSTFSAASLMDERYFTVSEPGDSSGGI